MIAALYVARGGCYFGLPDVDPWDEARDARLYAGPWAVVAHPPCTRWCQLAHVVQARYGYKIGEDGGSFAAALASVRKWGGVLEHPAESLAWPAFGLPRPRRGAWSEPDLHGGQVAELSQRAYGHRARKRTWLYQVGGEPPALDWTSPAPTATCSFMTNHGGGRALFSDEQAALLPLANVGRMRVGKARQYSGDTLPRLSKREASATPPAFRDLLLSLARGARQPLAEPPRQALPP